MNWKKIASIAGLSTLIMAAAPVSHAQVTSTASITGFNYKLVDLDPNDGIAPSLTVTNPYYWITAAAYPDNSGYPDPIQIISTPGTASITIASGTTASTYNGANASSNLTIYGASPRFDSNVITQWNFVLTPHTAVVVSGFGTIHGEQTGGLQAGADLQVFAAYYAHPNDQYEQYLSDGMYTYYGQDQSRALNLTFSSGDGELDGRFGLSTNTQGQGIAAAVPEPSTYAMLLSGLAALALAKRRRKAA
jgi:hypothetical protein